MELTNVGSTFVLANTYYRIDSARMSIESGLIPSDGAELERDWEVGYDFGAPLSNDFGYSVIDSWLSLQLDLTDNLYPEDTSEDLLDAINIRPRGSNESAAISVLELTLNSGALEKLETFETTNSSFECIPESQSYDHGDSMETSLSLLETSLEQTANSESVFIEEPCFQAVTKVSPDTKDSNVALMSLTNSHESLLLNGQSCLPHLMSDPAAEIAMFKAYPAPTCLKKRAKGSKRTSTTDYEFNYSSAVVPTLSLPCPELMNHAHNAITDAQMEENASKTLRIFENEHQAICFINRTCYIRLSLEQLQPYENIRYEKNPNFHISRPYEPQYIRYEWDPEEDLPINPSRCGLCPFCDKVNFLNLKTSSYAQHLALTHGVYTDNFLTPNPYNFGEYKLVKSGSDRITTPHENNRLGVVCPSCNQIIGTHCSQTTAKDRSLNNYLRHFRDYHRKRGKGTNKCAQYDFFSRLLRPDSYIF